MKSLRKLLGYDDNFFDLLESSAVEAQSSVQMLAGLLRATDGVLTLDELTQTRRKDKRITDGRSPIPRRARRRGSGTKS